MQANMFYVWEFMPASEDFEAVGCYSHREEAEFHKKERLAALQDQGTVVIVEASWREFIDSATRQRIGAIAKLIDRMPGSPWYLGERPAQQSEFVTLDLHHGFAAAVARK